MKEIKNICGIFQISIIHKSWRWFLEHLCPKKDLVALRQFFHYLSKCNVFKSLFETSVFICVI